MNSSMPLTFLKFLRTSRTDIIRSQFTRCRTHRLLTSVLCLRVLLTSLKAQEERVKGNLIRRLELLLMATAIFWLPIQITDVSRNSRRPVIFSQVSEAK